MKRYISASIDDLDNIKNDLENLIEEIDSISADVGQIYRKLPDYSADPICAERAALLSATRYLSQSINLIGIVKDYGYTEKFDEIRRQYDY